MQRCVLYRGGAREEGEGGRSRRGGRKEERGVLSSTANTTLFKNAWNSSQNGAYSVFFPLNCRKSIMISGSLRPEPHVHQ